MSVAIIDYGSGNLRSAAKAFERAVAGNGLDMDVRVTADPAVVNAASHIVLPGVGAFADCRQGLEALPGMVEALERTVLHDGRPFLGICVGMQLLATTGREHGVYPGLGWIAGEVVRLTPSDPGLKIPHMGWNELVPAASDHPVLAGITPGAHAYFVHSYGIVPESSSAILATCDYGGAVTAIVGRDNIIGTQFHPEKSQAVGLRLIADFLQWRP
ncbi:MAG: imidazole glycerol phosphate synthase subunit HisH [Rhodospirillales bacterium]|nr:MAG: imidazole glycerol phosphate synthase subunit HisH [Rhodospirillales bacterium]